MESFKKNERIYLTVEHTLADALAVNTVGVNTFYSLKGLVDRMVKFQVIIIYSIINLYLKCGLD